MRAWACMLAGVCVAVVAGCEPAPVYQSKERAAMLMRLAAQETDQIGARNERLWRLLKLADLQITQNDAPGARATLTKAAATVRACSADDLDTHLHVSAWVSISELSRRAGDTAAARAACQAALEFLRTVQPPAERIPYLQGLATEFRSASGTGASAAVLREGAKWASDMKDASQRRSVLIVLAHDLFLCDDYDGGRDVLRVDADANWRADTLIQLAQQAIPAPAQQMWAGMNRDVSFKATYAGTAAPMPQKPPVTPK